MPGAATFNSRSTRPNANGTPQGAVKGQQTNTWPAAQLYQRMPPRISWVITPEAIATSM